jgi:hypothetical protein
MREKVTCSVLLLFLVLTSVVLVDSLFHHSKTKLDESRTPEDFVSADIQQHFTTTQFYENFGQVKNSEISFFGSVPGGQIGFGISKVIMRANDDSSQVVLSFEGSQRVSPIGSGEASYNANFFLGDRGTFTNTKVYTSIVYENLWSGINLIYKGSELGAKYEFHVEPGIDPSQIQIRCEGHDDLTIREKSLGINLKDSLLVDSGIIAFQGNAEIEADFVPLDQQSYGFKIDSYDFTQPLIIDPVVYFVNINASLDDFGFGLTLDSQGSVYGTGWTESWDFPAINAYDYELNGTTDCFVFKFTPDGSSIEYSTFIGGSNLEQGDGIRVDDSGFVYVVGWTNSEDFPTVNPYNDTYSDNGDLFILKLSPNGDALIYSTYVGGSEFDNNGDIAIDNQGNAYVTGNTGSPDFPMVNAFDATYDNVSTEAFVFKINPDGNTLLYSSYFGGTGDDIAQGIEIDSSGHAYVTGWTNSEDLPTTENAFETEHTEWVDVFLFKLNPEGDSLVYCTYIGATRYEFARDIAVDEYGAVYMVGLTFSPDFPKVNAYDSSSNGDVDCFMLKVDAAGESLMYSTYIGGNDTEQLFSIQVDQYGCAYAGGFTDSPNFPMENAYNETFPGGDTSGVILKMDADGNELLYSTYIGSNNDDLIGAINLDSAGNVYAGGVSFGIINDTNNRDNSSAVFVVKLSDWSDGDRDNMPHAWEIENGLNPNEYDGDGDLDSDGLTNIDEYTQGTDPNNADSDGDGYSDGLEVEGGYDPLNSEIGIMQLLSYNLVYIALGVGVVILVVLYIKKDALSEMYWNR